MYTLPFPRARLSTIDIYANVLKFKESCFDFTSNTMSSNWENTPSPDLNYLVWTDERTDRQTYTRQRSHVTTNTFKTTHMDSFVKVK